MVRRLGTRPQASFPGRGSPFISLDRLLAAHLHPQQALRPSCHLQFGYLCSRTQARSSCHQGYQAALICIVGLARNDKRRNHTVSWWARWSGRYELPLNPCPSLLIFMWIWLNLSPDQVRTPAPSWPSWSPLHAGWSLSPCPAPLLPLMPMPLNVVGFVDSAY